MRSTSVVALEDWDTFMDCESAINKALQGRRVVALCSYDVRERRAAGILEVIQNHQVTLDRQDRDWEVLRRTWRSGAPMRARMRGPRPKEVMAALRK